MTEEEIIKEIENYRKDNIEDDSYIIATITWMEENDHKITKPIVNKVIPSFIISKIKEEVYNENLIRPSNNPNMNMDSHDTFTQLFY